MWDIKDDDCGDPATGAIEVNGISAFCSALHLDHNNNKTKLIHHTINTVCNEIGGSVLASVDSI